MRGGNQENKVRIIQTVQVLQYVSNSIWLLSNIADSGQFQMAGFRGKCRVSL